MIKHPIRLAVLSLLGLLAALLPIPTGTAQPAERLIRVHASSFAFDPGTIHANPGDQVTIELIATDYVHGLAIDEYGVSVTADPGQPARLTFTADRTGSFRIRCNVACGAMHPFMVGRLTVGPNLLLVRAVILAVLALAGAYWISRP